MGLDWTTSTWLLWSALLVGSFLLGAVPFGLLVGFAKGVDVRQHGSKNIGTANVGRTLGKKYGTLTFALDMLKGFIPTLFAGFWLNAINRPDTPPALAWAWLLVGIASVLGHMFPPYLKFRGGKGVATGFGVVLAIFPILSIPALLSICVWAVTLKVSRYFGFSSCLAAISLPLWIWPVVKVYAQLELFNAHRGESTGWPLWPYVTVAIILGSLVVLRHKSNLVRMLNGTEHRVGEPRPDSQAPAPKPG